MLRRVFANLWQRRRSGTSAANAHLDRGIELASRRDYSRAADSFRRAIACAPALPQPYLYLGNIAQLEGDIDGARAQYDAALARDSDYFEARHNRANLLAMNGEGAAASADFAAMAKLRPESPEVASNKLSAEIAQSAAAPEAAFAEYLSWGQRFAAPLAPAPRAHGGSADPGRRLRLGYVSADFRAHAMSHFIEPLLRHADAAGYEVHCYSDCGEPDWMTERLRPLAHAWHDIAGESDAKVALQIAADGIDLLVDLAGHTPGNRLLALARKPASVQFSYLGYLNTTGVAAIDYRITDAWCDPPGTTEAFNVETLLRLPDCVCCYAPPDYAPEVTPLPALAGGHVTFGSFNNFVKVNQDCLDAWAELVSRVPGSRMLIAGVPAGGAQRRVRDTFAARGIGDERLRLLARVPAVEYLRLRNEVDIALDPFPVNGGTTTCDSLWMGVPTVVLAGRAVASRFGVSLLHGVGLPDLATESMDAYFTIAGDLAADLPRLAGMRAGLRERMRASPLCDAPRFVRNLEGLYRQAWRQWCLGQDAGRQS